MSLFGIEAKREGLINATDHSHPNVIIKDECYFK